MALIEIDGLPLENGWIFPWRTVSHNQRVAMKNHHSKHGESSNYMGGNHHVSMAIFQKFQPSNMRGSPKETNTRGAAQPFLLQDCVRQDPDHREWNEVNVFPRLIYIYISISMSISISISLSIYIYTYICMYMYIRHLYGLSEHMVHMLRYSYWFIMHIKASPVSSLKPPMGRSYTSYSWLCIYKYIYIYYTQHADIPYIIYIYVI